MPQEQRRFSRVVFQVAAELKVGATTLTTRTIENLSVGGCLLPITGDFSIGSRCQVTIFLTSSPNSPRVRVNGEIVRCSSAGIGIKFTGIDPDSLHHLHNIIRYNANDPDRIDGEIQRRPGLI